MATDGVTDAISDEELATIVKKNGRVETIVEEVLLKVDRKPKLYKMTRA